MRKVRQSAYADGPLVLACDPALCRIDPASDLPFVGRTEGQGIPDVMESGGERRTVLCGQLFNP